MIASFKSAHGHWLRADIDNVRVDAGGIREGPWEEFTLEPAPEGTVFLRSWHGRYLSAEVDGRVTMKNTPDVWERWMPVPVSPGVGGLRSYHGRFLCADAPSGGVYPLVANRDQCGAWETWTGALWATPLVPARTGRTRLNGKCMSDDHGEYLALGSSLFWAVRGARSEPERMRQNALWLREQGCDFARVLCETTDWSEATKTDPRWPDYRTALRACRDIHQGLGLRVQWTLFGGNQLTVSDQDRCADDVLAMCDEKPETVQYVEISNENNGFHDSDGRDRQRCYARMFRDHGYIVALTSAPHGGDYSGSAADLATVHFDRSMRENGFRPVRQPWGYPGEYLSQAATAKLMGIEDELVYAQMMVEVEAAAIANGEMPATFSSGEPIAPGSSVCADYDPLRLGMAAVHTWLCGGAAHVVHSGAGIFGVQTSHPVGGNRPPNVWEQQGLEGALRCATALRQVLPLDLPNWQRTRHAFPDHPFTFPPDPLVTVGDGALARGRGCVRGYAAHRDGKYIVSPIGIMQQVTLAPQHAQNWTVHDGLTGTAKWSGTGTLTLDELKDGRAVLITGDYR